VDVTGSAQSVIRVGKVYVRVCVYKEKKKRIDLAGEVRSTSSGGSVSLSLSQIIIHTHTGDVHSMKVRKRDKRGRGWRRGYEQSSTLTEIMAIIR
jgi:hypothetical protein